MKKEDLTMCVTQKAEVVIRRWGRDIADSDRYFQDDIVSLTKSDPDWIARTTKKDDIFLGPFCYVPWELEIPF